MIQKLKVKTAEEVKKQISEDGDFGNLFADMFGPVITEQMPSEKEVMDKINEIIEHINKLERIDDGR